MTVCDLSPLRGRTMIKRTCLLATLLLATLMTLALWPCPCDASPSLTPSSSDNERNLMKVTLGAILPKTSLITKRRQYLKVSAGKKLISFGTDNLLTTLPQRLTDSVESLIRSRKNLKFNFTNHYFIQHAQVVNFQLDPQPTEILESICSQMLVQVGQFSVIVEFF